MGNFPTVFEAISPYYWGAMGTGIAISVSVCGAAWYGNYSTILFHQYPLSAI